LVSGDAPGLTPRHLPGLKASRVARAANPVGLFRRLDRKWQTIRLKNAMVSFISRQQYPIPGTANQPVNKLSSN
jgi:hypothetical protein